MSEESESSNIGELFGDSIAETTTIDTASNDTPKCRPPQDLNQNIVTSDEGPLRNHSEFKDAVPHQEGSHKHTNAHLVSGSLDCCAADIKDRQTDRQGEDNHNIARGNAAIQQELKDLVSQNKIVCDKYNALSQEKAQLKKELASKKAEVAGLRDEISDLREMHGEYQENLKKHIAEFERNRNKRLDDTEQRWRADKEDIQLKTQKHIKTLENVIHHYKDRIRVLENEKEMTAEQLATLNQQMATLENRCGEQSEELAREKKTSYDLYNMYEMERKERLTFMYKVLAGTYIGLIFILFAIIY